MRLLSFCWLGILAVLLIPDRGFAQQSRVDTILYLFHKQPQTVLVASHRGAHGHLPENSLVAMGAAIKAGAHILELDVRETLDGELLVMHDKTIDRTTDGKGEVSSMTLGQLRERALTFNGMPTPHRIPTLKEALLRCKDSIMVDIDFKAGGAEAAAAVCALVKELDMEDQVLFFLYDYRHMPQLHTLNPRIKIMPRAYSPADIDAILAMDIAPIVHIDDSYYSSKAMEPLLQKGIRIWANTLGEADKHAEHAGYDDFFSKMGTVNVVQTDEPQRLVEYLR